MLQPTFFLFLYEECVIFQGGGGETAFESFRFAASYRSGDTELFWHWHLHKERKRNRFWSRLSFGGVIEDFTFSFQFFINSAPQKTLWGSIAAHFCLSTALINHANFFASTPFYQICIVWAILTSWSSKGQDNAVCSRWVGVGRVLPAGGTGSREPVEVVSPGASFCSQDQPEQVWRRRDARCELAALETGFNKWLGTSPTPLWAEILHLIGLGEEEQGRWKMAPVLWRLTQLKTQHTLSRLVCGCEQKRIPPL